MRRLLSSMWSQLVDGLGAPLLIIFIPRAVKAILQSPENLRPSVADLLATFFGLSGQDLLWGTVLLLFYLLVQSYLRLEGEWGSRELQWNISRELGHHDSGAYFFFGSIFNGDTSVVDARVHLSDLKREEPGWVSDWVEMRLYRRGAGTKAFDLHNGEKLEFDIASIIGGPHPTWFFGHKEENKIEKHAGPGTYRFTLQLTGRDFKRRECRVKIKVAEGGGPTAIKVLEVSPDSAARESSKGRVLITALVLGGLALVSLVANRHQRANESPQITSSILPKKNNSDAIDMAAQRARIIRLGESLRKLSLENGGEAPYPEKALAAFGKKKNEINNAIVFIRIHGRMDPFAWIGMRDSCASGAIDTCGYQLKEGALSVP